MACSCGDHSQPGGRGWVLWPGGVEAGEETDEFVPHAGTSAPPRVGPSVPSFVKRSLYVERANKRQALSQTRCVALDKSHCPLLSLNILTCK